MINKNLILFFIWVHSFLIEFLQLLHPHPDKICLDGMRIIQENSLEVLQRLLSISQSHPVDLSRPSQSLGSKTGFFIPFHKSLVRTDGGREVPHPLIEI